MNAPDPPPLNSPQLKKDTEHLRLLAIFHFIFGGFAILGIAFLIFHFFIMRMVLQNPQIRNSPNPPPEQLLTYFMIFYAVAGLFLILGGILNILSGLGIRKRRNRVLSLITAGLNCLSVPFGTALGVFTFMVLTRDSVKSLYEP